MAPPAEGGGEGSICIGCGLCCDGTLFDHLAVQDPSDLGAPLLALGVELVVEADPPVFALPCPALDRGVCTVHHLHRPQACGWFECDLSAAVADGRIGRRAAVQVIADTLDLRDRVRAGLAERAELDRQLRHHFRDVADAR